MSTDLLSVGKAARRSLPALCFCWRYVDNRDNSTDVKRKVADAWTYTVYCWSPAGRTLRALHSTKFRTGDAHFLNVGDVTACGSSRVDPVPVWHVGWGAVRLAGAA